MTDGAILNVVLVGSSPLPCYIQVAYVQGDSSEIGKPDYTLFVATEHESDKYVKNIQAILTKKGILMDGTNSDTLKLKNGYDADEIENKVYKKISDICRERNISQILLNNTGGTKSMAVYATSAVRKFEQKIAITECFVDPRENRLRCYTVSSEDMKAVGVRLYPGRGQGTLKDIVKLNIDELVHLHYGEYVTINFSDKDGMNKKGKPFQGLDEGQCKIAQNILSDDSFYEKYCELHEVYDKYQGIRKKVTRIENMVEELQNSGQMDAMEEIFAPSGKKFDFSQRKDKEYVLTFMEGEWLEKYFYKALLEAKEKLRENNITIQTVWSCKVQPDMGKEFEVDILAIKGYELTLFSVSMADSDRLAKGKWFEAVYRTEQMAGEHGKVSVVNFLDNSDAIEKFKLDLATFQREVDDYNREDMGDYENLVQLLVKKFQ